MVDYQIEQGYKADVTEFQKCNNAGFFWSKSIEGHEFWRSLIVKNDFDLFFERYPKKQ